MASTEFSWDSFPAKELEGIAKEAKNNGDSKRRHDDLPRYNAPTDGNRKPRGAPFNNRNNQGRVSESNKNHNHDDRTNNGNRNSGRGGEQFNRQPAQRKQRTASDSYDDRDHRSGAPHPKSQPPKGQNRNFRNTNNSTNHRENQNNNDAKHRNANVKSEKESNTERELRQQIMRMKGHMLYLKDQNAYKDQVIHHKDQVILALRAKLEKLKVGSSENAGPSTAPVEPPKPDDLDKMEQDLATEDLKTESPVSSEEEKKEVTEEKPVEEAAKPAEEEPKKEESEESAEEKKPETSEEEKPVEEAAEPETPKEGEESTPAAESSS